MQVISDLLYDMAIILYTRTRTGRSKMLDNPTYLQRKFYTSIQTNIGNEKINFEIICKENFHRLEN